MASEHSSSESALHEMTPATISSGLVPNNPPSKPVDNPAPEVIASNAEVVAPVPVVSTGSPSSTTVNQDAPSPSNFQTTPATQTLVISNDVEKDNHDLDSGSGPALQEMIPGTISLGLVQKPLSSTSYVTPTRNDWDLLFQPLFDELLNPPPRVDNQDAEVIAPIAEVIPQVDDDSTGSPSSTAVDQDAPSPIDQDAPSPSKSPTPTEVQSSVILQDVGNDSLDIEVAHIGNDPLLGVPITEVASGQSLSTASPQSNVPVSTRLQLHEQALFCYYDAFLTSVEPKTYKEALTQACWIEAMQEELHEFERLEVWELVPQPDKVMVNKKQEKDKIGSKPNKNEKRIEAGKSLKQLQWVEEEKLSKTQKEWPKTQTQSKAIQV
nr:integrase, catalytic region, zinc finger, CCHC-type, peptidase aspartic, catalytic [Tanacetum cinerariifolium]